MSNSDHRLSLNTLALALAILYMFPRTSLVTYFLYFLQMFQQNGLEMLGIYVAVHVLQDVRAKNVENVK